MHHTIRQPPPPRICEPNIIHNPLTWFGIWTPDGWRVHRKRFGKAVRTAVSLSGDGKTTEFSGALIDTHLGHAAWQDDLHLQNDHFTDGGIYPADPRVEYPPGRPRWAVSHTLFAYPHADHGLYTHEYTWNLHEGTLDTHFRRHILLEETRTDNRDGLTLRVGHTPISTPIEGNVRYSQCNSAVRGVWTDPEKSSPNLYTQRDVCLIRMRNAVYAMSPRTPVVQCHGLYPVAGTDPLDKMFDPSTGICQDLEQLRDELSISLDQPKLGQLELGPYATLQSRVYEGPVSVLDRHFGVVDDAHIANGIARLGARFELGRVGYGAADPSRSYSPIFDLDGDGAISTVDIDALRLHRGRRVRLNLYRHAYFGSDWLSTSVCLNPNHDPGTPIIADYEYGGGYDADAGVVRLLRSPGPNVPVWIEYHHDIPADSGENNILVHLYREL